MILIAAALAEELAVALDLCRARAKVGLGSDRIWSATYGGQTLHFLKTGAGPGRAARRLEDLLHAFRPDRMLVIGYAGALAPELRLGDLVVIRRASIFGEKEVKRRPLDQLEITASFDLDGCSELYNLARSSGLPVHCGDGLTSPFIIGAPEQKELLHRRFKALSIDMETAALARAARMSGIRFSCVRAVSDDATDPLLAPFAYDPAITSVDRAIRILGAGNWRNRLQAWRERSLKARDSLRTFLRRCFEAWSRADDESSWLRGI